MTVARQFHRGVAWMAVGNWVEQAVNFAVFITLARLLGARDYGLLAMASVFIVMSEALVRESLSEHLIAVDRLDDEDVNATFWLLVGLGLGLALVLGAVAPIAAHVYGEPQVGWLILSLAPSVVIVALNAVPVALLRRRLEFRILALRAVAGVLLGGAVGIGLALSGFGVWSFVGQWLTMISTNAVLAWGAVDWRPGRATSRAHLGRAGSFGSKVLALRAGELAATQTPMLLSGVLLGPEATGLYAVAWRLVEALSFLVVTPLRQASQSAFAALRRSGGDAGALLVDIARLTGFVAIPLFAGLAVLAGPFILVVFGAAWAGAAPVLAVLAAMGIYLCLSRVQAGFCLAAGRAGAIAAQSWLLVAVMAALVAVAAPHGIAAVAAAVVVACLVVWPLTYREVSRIAARPALQFLSCHLRPALAAAAMAGVVVVADRLAANLPPLARLALTVPAGILVYGLVAVAIMRDRFELLSNLAGRGQRPDDASPP